MTTPRMMESESETLYALVAAVAGELPDAVAVTDGTGRSPDITFRELISWTDRLAGELYARGLRRGDCVGVYLPNWADAIVWQIAASAVGAHVIGINTRYGDAEVEHVLQKAQPTMVAIAHDFLDLPLNARLKSGAKATASQPPQVAVISAPGAPTPADEEARQYDCGSGAWVPGQEGAPSSDWEPDTEGSRLAVAFTTSGSTGKPKLAAHTSQNVCLHLRNCAKAAELGPDTVTLVNLPLSGVLAFVPAYAALASGGSVVLEPSFTPESSLDLMRRFAVTHLTCADDIAGRIKDAWYSNQQPLEHFRFLLFADFYGYSRSIAEWVEDTLGAHALGIFGSSEVFSLLTFWRSEDDRPDRWLPGGHPAGPGIQLRIVDQFDRTPLPAGETGEIEIRGYPVVDRYLGDDGTEFARNVNEDGWFHTGDQGRMPDDSTLVYTARLSDSLRLKGFLVEPMEIETIMTEVEDVASAKVVGIAVGGETRAIGFVSPKDGKSVSADAVTAHCAERLAKFKVPYAVHVLDDMPMTVGTNGNKIRSKELRRIAGELNGDD